MKKISQATAKRRRGQDRKVYNYWEWLGLSPLTGGTNLYQAPRQKFPSMKVFDDGIGIEMQTGEVYKVSVNDERKMNPGLKWHRKQEDEHLKKYKGATTYGGQKFYEGVIRGHQDSIREEWKDVGRKLGVKRMRRKKSKGRAKNAYGYMKRKSARARRTPGVSYQAVGRKPKVGSGKRYKALKRVLKKNKKVRTPGALAAWIGRRKYGKKRFQRMAIRGRRKR